MDMMTYRTKKHGSPTSLMLYVSNNDNTEEVPSMFWWFEFWIGSLIYSLPGLDNGAIRQGL